MFILHVVQAYKNLMIFCFFFVFVFCTLCFFFFCCFLPFLGSIYVLLFPSRPQFSNSAMRIFTEHCILFQVVAVEGSDELTTEWAQIFILLSGIPLIWKKNNWFSGLEPSRKIVQSWKVVPVWLSGTVLFDKKETDAWLTCICEIYMC